VSIERLHRPTRAEFEERFLRPQKPVIITGAMDSWPVLNRWSNEYLRERAGTRSLRISMAHRGIHFKGANQILDPTVMSLGEYIDLISSQRISDGRLYAAIIPIEQALPELWSDVRFPEYFDRKLSTSTNMWFGPGSNVSPLHYDSMHNFLTQVRGRKRVVLFPPGEIRRLYPFAFHQRSLHISQVNMVEPDHARFPEFQKAARMELVLEPGEMLFIPVFWWHGVSGMGENLSINYWWSTPVSAYLSHPRQTARGLVGLFAESARALLQRTQKPSPPTQETAS